MVFSLNGTYQVSFLPAHADSPITIDFTPPFRRMDMIAALDETLGISIPRDFESEGPLTHIHTPFVSCWLCAMYCCGLGDVPHDVSLCHSTPAACHAYLRKVHEDRGLEMTPPLTTARMLDNVCLS